jgi:HK97 family phage portal protein
MPKITRWQRIRSGLRFAFGRTPSPRIKVRQKQFRIMQPSFRAELVEWHLVDYQSLVTHGYQMNAVLYSAIAYKWRQVANAPLTVFQMNENNSFEIVDRSDPLQQLLKRPNKSMTGDELSQLIVTYLNIAGNAYTVISRSGGRPAGLQPLRPDRVFIMHTPTEDNPWEVTYWYRPKDAGFSIQDMIPILEQDIIHNKFPNPLDDLEGHGYGMSPLMPLAQSVDVDNEITRFLKAFFESGAVLPGYIQFDMELDQTIAGEVADRWMETHGGVDQWGDVAVFERGGKYVPVTPPFKELGFEEIDKRNEARILGPLGVPGILIGSQAGIQTNTYGTATLQARRLFWEDTMLPELRQIDSEFSNKLGGDNRTVAYDTSQVPALVDRNVERVGAMAELINTGTPRDEAYRLVGLPPVETPLGDVSWMPAGMLPYRDSGTVAQPEPEEPETEEDEEEELETAALPVQPPTKSLPPSEGLKLPEEVYVVVLAAIDQEIKASQKAKRTFDWETIPYALMAHMEDREYIPLLTEFANDCYHSGLSGHRGRADFVELFS